MDISKHDWDLYKARLPIWREAYMARLNDEIITYDDLKDFSSEFKDVVNFFINN